MSPFLIHGPGSHADLMDLFFKTHFNAWKVARYWPLFSIEEIEGGIRKGHSVSKMFDRATYLAYGVNSRLKRFNHDRQLHLLPLLNYYDHLCASTIDSPAHLVGWSQVSLKSILQNKKRGGKSLLEHPMSHVDYWMKVNQSFYDSAQFKIKPGYSRFSKRMIDKMKEEYEQADYIQVHSSFSYNTFVDAGVDPSKLLIGALAMDQEAFPSTNSVRHFDKQKQSLQILYVGRIELAKGVHLLLEALKRMSNPLIELTLVGKVLPEMEALLKSSTLKLNIVGSISKVNLSFYFNKADLLVFPSLNDAFGLVIVEAMAHGVPVIASKASAGPDIITDCQDGFIADSGSVEALIKPLTWAFENKEQLFHVGELAQEKAINYYLRDHYFDRVAANFRKIGFL